MQIPTKKLKSGFELPVYGMGLWRYSYLQGIDTSEDEPETRTIQAAIELGVTHFDTAERYGNGHSEEVFGRAISGYDRSKLVVATKVSWENQTYDGVKRAVEKSLKRIGTDYIDLYLLHKYPAPGIPIEDTMKAMDELVSQGVVKNIGVCNMTPNRFKEAQKHSQNKLVCNQLHYNVQYREVEDKSVLRFCQENDVLLVAWRPVQYGKVSQFEMLEEFAKKYQKTPIQVALNWLISQESVVTISKTNSLSHLKENLGAFGWEMETEDIERIRSEFPEQKLLSDVVPLDYEADIEL